MRRASRADANQAEIVAALRATGCSILHLHQVGKGAADVLAGIRGVNLLLEIKTECGRLTPAQRKWHEEWRGQIAVIRTAEEALELIGGD